MKNERIFGETSRQFPLYSFKRLNQYNRQPKRETF